MADAINKLGNSLANLNGVQDTDSGKLGYYISGVWRVVDPDDPKKFLVRFVNGTHVSAFHNNKVPQKYDLNVIVGKDHLGRPIILGEDRASNQNFHTDTSAGTNVGWHIHPRGGGMEFITDEWLWKHLRATGDVNNFTVTISEGSYLYNRELRWKSAGTVDLTSYVPALLGGYRWVVIGINPFNDSFVIALGNPAILTTQTPDINEIENISFVENAWIPLVAVVER